MAVLGAAGGKPTPAPSPAVSSPPSPAPQQLPLPSGPPLLPSHLLCLPWRTWWAAGGRSRVTLPLHPEGRGAPYPPLESPDLPSHLPL